MKKARTRRRLAEVALGLYAERGFEATTVEAICAHAEVAVSTFYVYFESKEAAAFADDEARALAAESALSNTSEPVHLALRAASLAVAAVDTERREETVARLRLVAGEPKLAAYGAQLQARYVERLATALATRMDVDQAADLRPRLAISAAFGALNAAWTAWAATPSADLAALVEQAHDILDAGFAGALRS